MYVLMLDTHIPIFSGTLIEYDNNQQMFLYWLKFYNHHVFSLDAGERPLDHIIDYDILLDEYLDRKEFREKTKGNRTTASDMNTIISFE